MKTFALATSALMLTTSMGVRVHNVDEAPEIDWEEISPNAIPASQVCIDNEALFVMYFWFTTSASLNLRPETTDDYDKGQSRCMDLYGGDDFLYPGIVV